MSDTYTYTQVRRVTPSGGSIVGGQSVTITGFGFAFATGSVTFGGFAATSVIIASNTQITAVTPPHQTGAVDVVVAGVGTGANLYTYSMPSVRLPPVPVASPVAQGGPRGNAGGLSQSPMELSNQKWLMQVKQVIESLPSFPVSADQIIGVLAVNQIPELPWNHIDKAGSSLADLGTRSASDLDSGVLGQPYGGTGRVNAFSFAPGSFTVQDGTFAVIVQSLQLTTTQSVTVLGSGILAVI